MAIAPDLPIPPVSRPQQRARVLAECARLAIEGVQGRPVTHRVGIISPRNRTIDARRVQEWQQAQRLAQRFRRA